MKKLKLHQKGIIITLIAIFTFVGINTTINGLEQKIKEEVTHEMELQRRREKIYMMRMAEGEAQFEIIMQEIGDVEDGTTTTKN